MKSTKKSLLMSVLSLVLCFAMLLGTTYAWFTDSVTSGVNQIKAGNLDVELYYATESNYNGASTNWQKVDSNTKLFNTTGTALWEPGYTETVYLKVVNEGTLALDYKFSVDVVSEVGSINQAGNQFKLSDYLVFGLTEANSSAPVKFANREAVWAAFGNTANLNTFVTAGATNREDLNAAGEAYFALAVYMPTSVGNEANYDTRYNAPEINFGVTLLASQAQHETDSFDNTYDAAATYPASAFVPTTDVIYPVVVSRTASTSGEQSIVKTTNSVDVAKATVSAVNVNDELAMHVIPTSATSKNYTLTSDQADKTYDIEVTVNGVKQTNVPMEIYVGKGLSNVKLYHSNETTPLTADYNPVTGMLTFTAPSFSEYHVVYDAPKYVAMVGGEYYATLRDAATAMNDTNYNFALVDEAAWAAATPVYWQTATKSGFAATMTLAAKAAYMANDGDITIVCRPGATVGTMSHVHVADNLTVFGNGASVVPGGDQDFEIDTYKYSRETGTQNASGVSLDKDINLNVYALNNIAVWGQRTTEYVVNVKLVACQNVNRIYFSTDKGTINIDVQNCSFDGAKGSHKNTSIKTDSQGTWNIRNTNFKDIAVAIALTNENGNATLNVTNCSFTDIATKANANEQSAADYASPIRVLGRSTATVTVDNCRFSYTDSNEKNFEDIVVGEVRGNKTASKVVEYTVKNTTGTLLSVEPHESNATISEIETKIDLNGSEVSGSNAKVVPVKTTEELKAAITAAKEGDVILISSPLNEITIPSFSKRLTLKGDGNAKAVFANDVYGASAASLPTGAVFEGFAVDCGNSLYHGFQHSGQITFKNCSFTGFLTTYNDMTFENCTFKSTNGKYSIDFYGGSNFNLTNCHFYGVDKNVYIYQETLDGDKNVTFKDCDFHMSGSGNTKSAIMLNAPVDWNNHVYNVAINNCTAEGGMNKTAATDVAGNTNYQGIYGLKHIGGGGAASLISGTVTVDGTVVYNHPAA